jgi:hypothetical protein
MRQAPSDRLLFFEDDEPGAAPEGADSRPNVVGAALFLLAIVVALAVGLYFLVGWHLPRMH